VRFLGVGDNCDLAALYLDLAAHGHDVKVVIRNPLCGDILDGLVEKTSGWRKALAWIAEAGDAGVVIFEDVRHGRVQDRLRAKGLNVVGGSAFGDRLENDRSFAQETLRGLGLEVAKSWSFVERAAAVDFIQRRPDRYVLKFDGARAGANNYVGQMPDGRDVAAFLQRLRRPEKAESFLLMERIDGVEMGVGAYFNGERFLRPACLDWEHKRFFPGDLGELTGEMGTVVTYERSQYFFERTLKLLEPLLRRNRHHGYVNLNTIINDRGVWPLELTCRFGYPGFSVLSPLQEIPWSELLTAMCLRSSVEFSYRRGFCVGIVMTVPPFPYEKSQVGAVTGLPVLISDDVDKRGRSHLHYYELAESDGQLVTAGAYGWAMVVTGTGADIAIARHNANALASRVLIPNLRYRRDIGERLLDGEFARIEAWGMLGPTRGVRRLRPRTNAMVEFSRRRAFVLNSREKQWTL
jgi:phosphoribosylamine--glycine ligase